MRMGIMGGTLDPVHSGHMQIAALTMRELKLDGVMLLPAGDPPHKENPTDAGDRLNMARLAAKELPGMFACSAEVLRGGTTYTVDTLGFLRENNPSTEWIYIIGADTLDVLDSWRSFERVAGMCVFAVIGRADAPASRGQMRRLEEKYGARFIALPFSGPDISSTEIRGRVASGGDISGMVPAAVADYIRERGLYLCGKGRGEILKILSETLKPGRYDHTLGVAETARRLAGRFGVDPMRAELAGLLHDCAKYLPLEEMRRLVRENVADADESELETESVLHAPAGMVYAREVFGVRDAQILSAIRRHTLGDGDMSAMDALIYTADFIEPGRGDFPGMKEARRLAEEDIFAAARKCAELTNDYLKKQGKKPHAKTISMLRSGMNE